MCAYIYIQIYTHPIYTDIWQWKSPVRDWHVLGLFCQSAEHVAAMPAIELTARQPAAASAEEETTTRSLGWWMEPLPSGYD